MVSWGVKVRCRGAVVIGKGYERILIRTGTCGEYASKPIGQLLVGMGNMARVLRAVVGSW